MSEKTFYKGMVNITGIMVISKGEAGGRIREEADISFSTVLFLKLNCDSYTLVLKLINVHFIIVLHNIYTT